MSARMIHHLPPAVVARCAATDGTWGGCHGASASGANELAADNPAYSLRVLSADMAESYAKWLAKQARIGGAA